MFNVTFTGRLGADPSLRFGKDGKAMVSMRVAHTARLKTPDGGWTDGATGWYAVALFGAQAENAAEQLRKGSHVLVAGRASPREYEHNGAKVQTLDVVADTIATIPGRAQPPAAPNQPADPPW